MADLNAELKRLVKENGSINAVIVDELNGKKYTIKNWYKLNLRRIRNI